MFIYKHHCSIIMAFEKDWNRIDKVPGWLFKDEARMLYRLAGKSKGPIYEIGSWKGRSSVCLGLGARNNPNKPVVICIDPFTGSKEHKALNPHVDTFKEFCANIKRNGLEETCFPYRRTSREAFECFGDEIGLLFVDGSHEYVDAKFDVENWGGKVVKGGWICMHDCGEEGPRSALQSFLNTGKYRITKPISTMVVTRVM
jgi:hypothetical protein